MPTSPDTLLRVIRGIAERPHSHPRVLGVDEWAFRRGHRYGTILCDLEQHRVVDLLPERSSESFAAWLTVHSGVEIITRDRADYFAQGATAGAPHAVQVADRWHLLKNARDALARVADHYPQQLTAAAQLAASEPMSEEGGLGAAADEHPIARENATREEQLKELHRAKRLDRYERVRELHSQGVSRAEIARQLRLHRETVAKYLKSPSFPERARRIYPRRTDPFVRYLRKRWEEGCHNAIKLTSELKQRGFDGSYHMVRRRIAQWRDRSEHGKKTSTARRVQRPSSRRVAWLLLKPGLECTAEETRLLKAVCQQCTPLETAGNLTREFYQIVRERQLRALDDWVTKASGPGVPEEMGRFAKGLQEDWAAVNAALLLPWSNGQTEGQVNRLKLVKRQMYGRANFDLLRQRVLHAA